MKRLLILLVLGTIGVEVMAQQFQYYNNYNINGSIRTFEKYYRKKHPKSTKAPQPVSEVFDYKIVFKTDSVVLVTGRIKIEDPVHTITYTLKGKEYTVKPSDTKEIICTSYRMKRIGIPGDSCWLFQTIKGTINGYSYLPKPENLFIVGIQKGNEGPIVPLNSENLMVMVADSYNAKKMVDEGEKLEVIEFYNTLEYKK